VGLVHATRVSKRAGAAIALALAALISALALSAASAPVAGAATCPSFQVLHNDRIGAANLPAGNYTITTSGALTCASASQALSRFLQDWDGNLPAPWRVVAHGTGKASFPRGAQEGFSVARTGGGEGGNPSIGRLCAGTFTVNASSDVGPLFFPKGQYLIYQPAGTGITCHRASVLFTRFLGAGGILPSPWKLTPQTATFSKPAHPQRSAFRVEPLAGAGA